MLSAMQGRGKAMASPGVSQLKEAFDVTYAVHRAEEEGQRKKNRNVNGGFLTSLNEEDEEEEDSQPMTGGKSQLDNHRKVAAVNAARQKEAIKKTQDKEAEKANRYAENKSQGRSNDKKPRRTFDLNLNQSTIIEKRKQRQVQQEASKNNKNGKIGSPMRMD